MECDSLPSRLRGRELLPKLLGIRMKSPVSLDRIALVLVVSLLDREIGRLVDVEGGANVLRNVSQILTL